MKKRMVLGLPGVLAALLLLIAGCGSEPEPLARVEISGPAGMNVSVADHDLGEAPMSFKLRPGTYLFKFVSPKHDLLWQMVTVGKYEVKKLTPELQPRTSAVMLVTRPAGARVVIDGKVVGSTPIVFEKQQVGATYTAQWRMPGYAERSVNWTADDERPRDVVIDLDENVGKLSVDSVPSKARLSIDGKVVGTTPYEGELTEGRYQFRLELDGFTPLEQSISISRGEQLKKVFPLTALPGGIKILSIPEGAEVYVDNVKRGVTPCVVRNLPAAKHQIRVEKDGFDPAMRTVEVTSGYHDEITLQLIQSTGGFELDVRPAGVEVLLDGKKFAVTEASNDTVHGTKLIRKDGLSAGRYEISLVHRRANPPTQSFTVVVEKGKVTRPKPIEVWIANCEIRYRDGRVVTGVLYQELADEILFGPEPGVKFSIRRDLLDYVKKLDVTDE